MDVAIPLPQIGGYTLHIDMEITNQFLYSKITY